MSHSRREFLKAASIVALSLAARQIPGYAAQPAGTSGLFTPVDRHPRIGDPFIEELAAAALEAAQSAGAAYADVRLSVHRSEIIRFPSPTAFNHGQDYEYAGIGVRALVDGAWGFASSALWTEDEAVRLGRQSAAQARTNAKGRIQAVELGPPPKPVTGEWSTPIERDPFDVPLAEKVETAWALIEQAGRYNVGARNVGISGAMVTEWDRLEKTFASTDGARVSQAIYRASPSFSIGAASLLGRGGRSSDVLQPRAGGFEVLSKTSVLDEMPRLIEDAILMIESELITPDRYDVVLDARLMAHLVANTIGTAAELDRVLGYEANAGGTSYLAPPEEQLGALELAPSILNVRANRSHPSGWATVRWDDEGVEPTEYDVIKDGVLVDYHTTRELSQEVRELYEANGRQALSHGGASSEDARAITMLHPPNIEVLPSPDDTTLDDLVSGMEKGLVFSAGSVTVDRQQLNGEIGGEMVYEVRDGERTGFVHRAEALIRAPELWENLQALGGESSQLWTGTSIRKGSPMQTCKFSVGAVPGLFKNVVVTDRTRKA